MKYQTREIESLLARSLRAFPATGIMGPRQSGKSTLLTSTLPNYQYVSFDDLQTVAEFQDDPVNFMTIYNDKVIFDEVQHVPKIFNYLKMAIDNDRENYGKFVITGSSQFNVMQGVSESLAGRIGLLSLLPFQLSEMPDNLIDLAIYKGSYPELANRGYLESDFWFSAYIDTYLSKDVRQLIQIGDIRDFHRFLKLLAANVTHVLDMSSYARAIGVSLPTIKRWLSVLEASYIVFTLPPFYNNFGKRIIKRPKVYFYDTGLLCHLVGIETKSQYENGPMAGSIFENHVISEVLKRETHHKTNSELFYYRTSHGVEIDLIIDRKDSLELIEIKKNSTYKPKMLHPIKQFIRKQDKGYLLYCGETRPQPDNLQVINYKTYLLNEGSLCCLP